MKQINLTQEQAMFVEKILTNVLETFNACSSQNNKQADILESFGIDPSVFDQVTNAIDERYDHISNVLFKLQQHDDDDVVTQQIMDTL